MKSLWQWLDHRTGYRQLADLVLKENVPGGSRWRYVWGSTLMFTLAMQAITGVFLWMAYSPSAQTAWPSVYYIQYEMLGGWLLRGLHHFTAQAMIVLLGIHLLQVVFDGAYRAPREMNFWFGLILLQLVLALSLTGYLLPWDQKGYWATKVATNIAGVAPVLGPLLQRIVVGGPDYGHATLTRFFALHAGVLPGMVLLLLTGHIYLFRRHGLTAKTPLRRPDQAFWPDQVLKDALACLVVMAAVMALVLRHQIEGIPGAPGAELGAPADATEPYSAARPEWYFLFMFQFLKLFPHGTEVWGAIIIPSVVLTGLFLMPFIGQFPRGHRLNCAALFALGGGIVLLTVGALRQDRNDPGYQAAVKEAERQAGRAVVLAQSPRGIPPTGGVALLRTDPLTQGPRLFAKNCASCHRFDGHDGLGRVPLEPPSASDLKGFAGRQWLTGFLDPEQNASLHYFGGTALKDGKMARFVRNKISAFSPEDQENLKKVVAALSAEAGLKSQQDADQRDKATIRQGAELLKNQIGCTDCHRFHNDDPDATAPILTGFGSREWLVGLISHPGAAAYLHDRNDRMPAFGDQHMLTPQEIELLADWLRGDWYEPPDHSRAAATASTAKTGS